MARIIGIVGATGNVGRQVVAQILDIAKPQDLRLFASKRSAGQRLEIAGSIFTIEDTTPKSLEGCGLYIFNTEADISQQFVPLALGAGAYVVDSSSHYRLHADVPLIVPPVNVHEVNVKAHLYAHANCLVSPIATVVAPLHRHIGIKRVEATTYQSTSGAGKGPMDECWAETKHLTMGAQYERKHFARQIAFNVIPQVGSIGLDNFTTEEAKIIAEVRKVVGDIGVTATAVRVPVMIGHSIALSIELAQEFDITQVQQILQNATSVKLSANHYTTPVEVVGLDDVFVGRLRRNPSMANGLQMWLCSDNLRRGAATDAVEIATAIIQKLDAK